MLTFSQRCLRHRLFGRVSSKFLMGVIPVSCSRKPSNSGNSVRVPFPTALSFVVSQHFTLIVLGSISKQWQRSFWFASTANLLDFSRGDVTCTLQLFVIVFFFWQASRGTTMYCTFTQSDSPIELYRCSTSTVHRQHQKGILRSLRLQ